VADAQTDSTTLVVHSAQVGLNRIYKESHQSVDLVSMFRPVTKWARRSRPAEELAYRLGDDRHAWVQVIRGAMVLNGASLTAGDGVVISKNTVLQIRTTDAAGLLLFNLA